MLKNLYVSAWVFWAAAVLILLFAGAFDPPSLLISSLVALALVYALALWSVFSNTREVVNK